MFGWIKKLLADRPEHDEFSRQYLLALGGFKEKTGEFVAGVTDHAMEKEMAELRERIVKLEAILLPLRNGAVTH